MSGPQPTDAAASDDAMAAAAAGTLAEIGEQIAGRRRASGDASEVDARGALQWADLADTVLTRLAADEVISTNRDLTQRSLRDFLR